MQRLLKLLVLTTIVVLNCSTSWCQDRVIKGGVEPDTIPTTGVLKQTDTLVTVPITAIKIANSKMIELEYEKEINEKLKNIVANDSLIIEGLNTELNYTLIESDLKIKKIKRERNYAIIGGATVVVLFFVSLFK